MSRTAGKDMGARDARRLATLCCAGVGLAGPAVRVAGSAVGRAGLTSPAVGGACLAGAAIRRASLARTAVRDDAGVVTVGVGGRSALTGWLARRRAGVTCLERALWTRCRTADQFRNGVAWSHVRIGKRRQIIAVVSATGLRNRGGALQSAAAGQGFPGAQPDIEIEIVFARLKSPRDRSHGFDLRAFANEDSGSAQTAKR